MPSKKPDRVRVDLRLDSVVYERLKKRLADPMRRDGRMKHGALHSLITTLLIQWLNRGITLEELSKELDS